MLDVETLAALNEVQEILFRLLGQVRQGAGINIENDDVVCLQRRLRFKDQRVFRDFHVKLTGCLQRLADRIGGCPPRMGRNVVARNQQYPDLCRLLGGLRHGDHTDCQETDQTEDGDKTSHRACPFSNVGRPVLVILNSPRRVSIAHASAPCWCDRTTPPAPNRGHRRPGSRSPRERTRRLELDGGAKGIADGKTEERTA